MLAGVRADSIYCLPELRASRLRTEISSNRGNLRATSVASELQDLSLHSPSIFWLNPCLIYLLNYCSTTRRFSPKERYPTRQAILALK